MLILLVATAYGDFGDCQQTPSNLRHKYPEHAKSIDVAQQLCPSCVLSLKNWRRNDKAAAVQKSKHLFSSTFRAASYFVANCMVHAFGSVNSYKSNLLDPPLLQIFYLTDEHSDRVLIWLLQKLSQALKTYWRKEYPILIQGQGAEV